MGTVVASGLADCGNGWLNRQLRFLQGVERSARVLQAAPQPQGYRIVWASGCERSGAAAASVPAALATLSSPPLLQMQVALVAFAGGHQKGMAELPSDGVLTLDRNWSGASNGKGEATRARAVEADVG